MTTAFLLRFQESCRSAPAGPVCTGTETHTYVRSEQVDTDPRHHSFNAVPKCGELTQDVISSLSAGTKTVTEVRQESADNDPTNRQFETFPKVPAR